MKIAIAGATSFIGMHLLRELSQKSAGDELVAVVRKGSKQIPVLKAMGSHIDVKELDLDEYENLGTTVGAVDCLVYLTWNGTRGSDRDDYEMQKYNYEKGMQAIQSVLQKGCKKIMTAGSQAEYGPWFETRKITEKDPECPNTEYGEFKLRFYRDALKLVQEAGGILLEPRFFSLYGAGDFGGTMIISMLKNMMENKKCELTECVQLWDFLYIDDAISGLIKLIWDVHDSGVFNFGFGDSHELKHYVMKMYELVGSQSEMRFGAVSYPRTGMVNVNPDVTKLRSIGWEPEISFESGVCKIIESLKEKEGN